MEQPETNENAAIEPVEAREASPVVTPAQSVAGPVITQGAPGCPTCGAVAGAQNGGTASSSYVYALGQIEARFPRPSVEKEVAQATGGRRPRVRRISRLSMRSCRDARTAISRGNCAGS